MVKIFESDCVENKEDNICESSVCLCEDEICRDKHQNCIQCVDVGERADVEAQTVNEAAEPDTVEESGIVEIENDTEQSVQHHHHADAEQQRCNG